jgi:hypothetical protein
MGRERYGQPDRFRAAHGSRLRLQSGCPATASHRGRFIEAKMASRPVRKGRTDVGLDEAPSFKRDSQAGRSLLGITTITLRDKGQKLWQHSWSFQAGSPNVEDVTRQTATAKHVPGTGISFGWLAMDALRQLGIAERSQATVNGARREV